MVTISSVESLDSTPTEIAANVPRETRDKLRHELTDLTERLGERWHGGAWHAHDDHYREERRSHTDAHLRDMGVKCHDHLRDLLLEWAADPEVNRVHLLLLLWQECWELWDAYLIYRTLDVVAGVVGEIIPVESPEDWEPAAWRAVGKAFSLATTDANVFRQIVLSNPAELEKQATRGVETTTAVIGEIRPLLNHPDAEGDPGTARGLRRIESVAIDYQFYYEFLAAAARALGDFHQWLAAVPQLRAASATRPPEQRSNSEEYAAEDRKKLLKSIDAALELFRSRRESLSVILTEAEPWEQLLTEIRAMASREVDQGDASLVFVPHHVSIRYCYPFAVRTDANSQDTNAAWLNEARRDGRIAKDLNKQLAVLGVEVQDVKRLEPTAFFAAQGTDRDLYGGAQVELPDIMLSTGEQGEQASRCRVWITLSRMGNHCLCIEREALERPLPHDVYRAVAAGAIYAFGATTSLGGAPAQTSTWDNLHSFGRDVIHAVASAEFWPTDQRGGKSSLSHYRRGNLHEVIVVRTDSLGTAPEDIAAKLNAAVGGQTLLKSVQTTPVTSDEWVRFPPATPMSAGNGTSGITNLPELGLAGDWCVNTGESTVFGIVATPPWHSNVYMAAGQFANSWSPFLRLWSECLQEVIEEGQRDAVKEAADAVAEAKEKENRRLAHELREIEGTVRRHLTQIQGEDLCAALSHRRFLDRLLKISGVVRLQEVLESQLVAAERLMDWWDDDIKYKNELARRKREEQQKKSNNRRDQLLGVIALFGMFELGGFLELGNDTNWHQGVFGLFTLRKGVWEDWLVTGLFIAALVVLAVVYFRLLEPDGWLSRRHRRPSPDALSDTVVRRRARQRN